MQGIQGAVDGGLPDAARLLRSGDAEWREVLALAAMNSACITPPGLLALSGGLAGAAMNLLPATLPFLLPAPPGRETTV